MRPDAAVANEEHDASRLDGIAIVYVVVERDSGGDAVLRWLRSSSIRHRARLILLDGFKDPSEMHVDDPERFPERWQAAKDSAPPWSDRAAALLSPARDRLFTECRDLALSPDVLGEVTSTLRECAVVGEQRLGQLLFLVLVTRLFDRPVSVLVEGPSSAGKSYVVSSVLRLLPKSTHVNLTCSSPLGLIYAQESLSHRFVVLVEKTALENRTFADMLKTLLSEGFIERWIVELQSDRPVGRVLRKDGPTGLISTTTDVAIDPEWDTRVFCVPVTESSEHTADILRVQIEDSGQPDLGPRSVACTPALARRGTARRVDPVRRRTGASHPSAERALAPRRGGGPFSHRRIGVAPSGHARRGRRGPHHRHAR